MEDVCISPSEMQSGLSFPFFCETRVTSVWCSDYNSPVGACAIAFLLKQST